MKNKITELVFILDCSGSMAGLEKDTVGGFNSMIERQKKEEGDCYVTTVLFNNDTHTLHDRQRLSEIKPMTEKDYFAGGCTALLDAIGSSIKHIASVHRYIRPEDVPEHTVFVITTDGMENASCLFTAPQVRELIEHEKEKYGWEFIFMAANIDAVGTAGSLGINADRAVDYISDNSGTEAVFEAASEAVSQLRVCGGLASDWDSPIRENNKMER